MQPPPKEQARQSLPGVVLSAGLIVINSGGSTPPQLELQHPAQRKASSRIIT